MKLNSRRHHLPTFWMGFSGGFVQFVFFISTCFVIMLRQTPIITYISLVHTKRTIERMLYGLGFVLLIISISLRRLGRTLWLAHKKKIPLSQAKKEVTEKSYFW